MTETASAPETGATAIADLPTGEPIPSSAPADSETCSSTAAAPRRNLAALLKTLPSNTDAFLAHLQRCLATPSGVDTLLLFICYTSRFAGAALANLSQSLLLPRRASPRDLVALAFTLPDKTAVVVEATAAGAPTPALAALVARLAGVLGTRLKSLGGLASEARTIARLWSLVGMYFWAKRLVLNLVAARSSSSSSSSDSSEKKEAAAAAAAGQGESKLAALVSWAQLLTCGAFQVLENGAYLSGRGVLGWTPAQQGRAYVVGSRFLGIYTALELGRLLAEFVARRDQKYAEASAEEQAEIDALRRSAAINMAWAPLTLHWSTDKGFLTDLVVGAGGCIPGVIQMRKLWRETA
ncbi:putative peroxin 11c [Diaporthe ampelina]|uniref:Putative peroxin 11c n=1 Tax=Diaporthe ampelina TaxID=1214573 RepID=A0A0G2G028_9PEZI|nr:putative peroxin 11c [Diaporthe ampelina]